MSLGLRQNPTSQAFAAGTSITPTGLTTTGWASGDIILAFVEVVSTATCTPATSTTGWNTTGTIQQGTTGVVSALFWLKYNGTSYTTPTITWTGSYKSSVKFVVISGADGTTPVAATNTNSGSGTAMTAKTATSTRRGSLRLCMFFKATTATAFSAISSDINQLEQANVGTLTSTGRFGLFAQWNMAENAAGDKLATQTTTASWVAWQVWVQPAVADQFGITRIAQAGTRGSAATSKTATLSSTDVIGSNPGATIAVYGSAFNSNMTATIGGVAPTNGPGLSISSSIAVAGWYAFNQTAANGTAVNVVVTRASGSDSIEVFAVEFLGGATSVDPLDQKGAHQSAAAATTNAVSTTSATASGTEFSVYAITDDANPGGLVADTNYNTNNAQQSGTTSAIPLLNASRQFTGGSTETATSTTAASNSLALIMTFAAPVASQAITGTVSGTAPGPFALPSPHLTGKSIQSTSNTERGTAKPLSMVALSPARSTSKGLSTPAYQGKAAGRALPITYPKSPLLGKASGLSTLGGRVGPSAMSGRSANFARRAVGTPSVNLGSPTGGGVSLLDRAALATWRDLGALTADVFHEADILYDSGGGYYYVVNTSADGNSGDPHIGWRRATTLEGIVSASGSDRVERALNGVYYPSFFLDSNNWYIIGTAATGTTDYNKYTGVGPPSWSAINNVVLGFYSGSAHVSLVDASIRKNPEDGYFYLVGLDDSGVAPFSVYIYRTMTPDTQSSWAQVGTGGLAGNNVFRGGYPSWASTAVFDPNLMFVDGRAYLGFSGSNATTRRSGIVEINLNAALPIGAPLILNQDALYPWQPQLLSDLVFLRCPDEVDRIFGFATGPFDGSVNGVWGCLDLQASAGRWNFAGPSVRGLVHPYARATSQGVASPKSLPSHSLIGRAVGKALSSIAPSSHFTGSSTGRARASVNPSISLLGRSTGKGGALATPFGSLLGRSVGKAGARSAPFGNLLGKSVGKSGALSSPLGNLLGKSSGKTAASASTLTGLLGRSVGRALSSLITRSNLVGLSQSKPSAAAGPGSSLTGKSSSKSSASMSPTGSLSGQSSGRTSSALTSASHLVGLAMGKAHSFGSIVSSAMVAITGRSVGSGAASGAVSSSMSGRSTSKPAAQLSLQALLSGKSAGKTLSSLLGRVRLGGQSAGRTTAQGTFSAPNMVAMVGRSVGSAIASARSASRLSAESSGTSGARLAPSIRLAGLVGRSAGTASGSIKVLLRGLSQGYSRLSGTGAAVYRVPRRLTGTTVASESFSSTSMESVAASIEPATSQAFASSAVGQTVGVEPTLKESVSSKVRINP